MTAQGWLQIALYGAALTALTPVIGAYMSRVFRGERVLLTPVVGPLERLTYRCIRADPNAGRTGAPTPGACWSSARVFWLCST